MFAFVGKKNQKNTVVYVLSRVCSSKSEMHMPEELPVCAQIKRCIAELLIHIPLNCCGFKVQTVIRRNDSKKLKTIRQLGNIAKLD